MTTPLMDLGNIGPMRLLRIHARDLTAGDIVYLADTRLRRQGMALITHAYCVASGDVLTTMDEGFERNEDADITGARVLDNVPVHLRADDILLILRAP